MKYNFLKVLSLLFIAALISGCVKKEPMIQKSKIIGKVLVVIASQGFQDIEYSQTREVLEENGGQVVVASSQKLAQGKFGAKVEVDKLIDEVELREYDGLIFIGGPGALEYIDDLRVHKLIEEAVSQNKILGAICIAPEILAKAGVLRGKKATVWSSPFDREPIKFLEENGAIFVDEEIVIDGKIITANGPGAAKKFGLAIVKQLSQ